MGKLREDLIEEEIFLKLKKKTFFVKKSRYFPIAGTRK